MLPRAGEQLAGQENLVFDCCFLTVKREARARVEEAAENPRGVTIALIRADPR